MKPSLLALAALACLLAVASSSPGSTGGAGESTAARQLYSPPRELVHYGHVRSLTRAGAGYRLRFDPAFWLGGTTANRAAVEDGAIQPGEVVPNDYHIRDESKRVLTYRVPASASVTVITSSRGLLRSTQITVAELSQIVKGRNPQNRRLFDRRNGLGYWIRVATDTVRSLDQQYQP